MDPKASSIRYSTWWAITIYLWKYIPRYILFATDIVLMVETLDEINEMLKDYRYPSRKSVVN